MTLKNYLRIQYHQHIKTLSDHVGITVEILNEHGILHTYKKR